MGPSKIGKICFTSNNKKRDAEGGGYKLYKMAALPDHKPLLFTFNEFLPYHLFAGNKFPLETDTLPLLARHL